MASAVTSVAERRACLERALRINPNNARAREALRRLEATPEARPRDSVDLRETELRRARRIEQEGGGRQTNPYFILAGVVLVFVVIAAVLLLNEQGDTPTTQQAAEATDDQAAIAVASPRAMPTLTLVPGSIVTLDPGLITPLPPTFTPTFTATATEQPPATATPVPLAAYQFYYAGAQPGQPAALYSVRGDASQELQHNSGGSIRDLALSPDGSQVVFVRASRVGLDADAVDSSDNPIPEAGLPQLFVAPRDDVNAAVQITQARGSRLESPQWSPDGSRIAFAGDADGDLDIYVIAASGGEPVRLTDNPGVDTDPAWSPDGGRIAFASDRSTPAYGSYPGSLEIFVMNDDGSDPAQLTDAANDSFSPAWSPDGASIVFVSNRSGDNDLYIMDASGEGEELLTFDDSGAEDRKPVFTADGRWIAFLSNRDGERFQLYLVDPRGVAVTRVTNNDRDIQSVAAAPGIS